MPAFQSRHLVIVAAAVVALGAVAIAFPNLTGRDEAAPPPSAAAAPAARGSGVSEAARVALDRGNTAYRAGKYQDALAAYREAAKADSASAAPHFGVLMAAGKIGDSTLAASARAEIAKRVDTASVAGDSAMRAAHPVVNPH